MINIIIIIVVLYSSKIMVNSRRPFSLYAQLRNILGGVVPISFRGVGWLLSIFLLLSFLLLSRFSYVTKTEISIYCEFLDPDVLSPGINLIVDILSLSPAEDLPLHLQSFPKKIWQSWKDDADDPTDRTVGFPHRWRMLNPQHRYERLTDANSDAYVKDNFAPDVSDLFLGLTDPILRADFLRYLVMVKEGGLWADIDVLPHQPISSWIPEEYLNVTNLVIGIENDHHKQPIWPDMPYSVQLAQYTILSKPRHPALVRLVRQVRHNLDELLREPRQRISFEDVMATTGPFVFTKVLMEYFSEVSGKEHTGDELDNLQGPRLIGDVLVLPKDSFGWLPHEHSYENGDASIFVEHLFMGSWRSSHPG